MTSSPQLPSTIPWALSVGADELDGTHTPHWLALDDPRFHEHAEIERVLNPAALTGGSISPSVIPLTGNMISPTSPPGTPPTLAGTSASATPVTPPPQVSVESEYTDEEVLQDTAAATVIGNGTDGGGLSAPPGVAAAAAAAVTALDIEMDMSEIFDYDHFMGSQVSPLWPISSNIFQVSGGGGWPWRFYTGRLLDAAASCLFFCSDYGIPTVSCYPLRIHLPCSFHSVFFY